MSAVLSLRTAGGIIRAGFPQVLAASAVAISNGATVTEDTFATINIPAGAMGLNGILRVTTLWTVTNSANNKALRIRLGGIGGTDYLGVFLAAGNAGLNHQINIANRGIVNSQICHMLTANSFSTNAGAQVIAALDTSVAQTLVITGQKALAGETITLESYLVELILPPGG